MATPLAAAADRAATRRWSALPYLITATSFALLFAKPATLLVHDWWTNPEAGHGLLLFPVALWLAWKRGLVAAPVPARALGMVLLLGAALLRVVSELSAELFTMRLSMVLALAGLVVYYLGRSQLKAWWLPFVMLALSIPLPVLITSALALPLQFKASQMGAALLQWRQIPVRLSGNILSLPGHQLFVTEACSGLRSLTALLSIGVMFAGLFLSTIVGRVFTVAMTIPIAIVINGVRVFITGFLVYFVSPKLGEGFLHVTEGWLLFLVSLALVSLLGIIVHALESRVRVRGRRGE